MTYRTAFTIVMISLLGSALALASPILTPEQWVKLAIYTPQPAYPVYARSRHITGDGEFRLRIQIRTGRVKEVQVKRSTGSEILDSAAISALQRWRFKPGALPAIKIERPQLKDSLATEDSFLNVPMSFAVTRNGVIIKGRHSGLSVHEVMSRDRQGH